MAFNQLLTDCDGTDANQILSEQYDPEEYERRDPDEDFYPDQEISPDFTVCATCTCGWYDWNPSVVAPSLGEAIQSQIPSLEASHIKGIYCQVTYEGSENK